MTHPSESDGQIQEAPAEASTATSPGSLEAELAEARARADEHWNSYLRAVAETDNVRKRAQRDVESASRYAIERFAGVAAGASAEAARLLEGMDATLRLLNRAFEKSGLSVVDPAGQPFNPEFHEAMATQPSADQPPGTVLAVVQKGYLLNGRLLRPARVLVAREPDPPAN